MGVCINLDDDEQAYPSTHLWRVSIHASHNIYNGLSNGDDHSEHCGKDRENDLQFILLKTEQCIEFATFKAAEVSSLSKGVWQVKNSKRSEY